MECFKFSIIQKGAKVKKVLSHTVWVPKKQLKVVYRKLKEEIGIVLRRLNKYKGIDLLDGKACMDHY